MPTSRYLWLTSLALGLLSPLPAQAQQVVVTGGGTIFENVVLSPTFSSTTVRGISGGPVSATQLAQRSESDTGPCLGFVDQQPDHQMVLTNRFAFLSLQVQSTADTTLVVRGPGGVWCNDNYTLDFNPGIVGEWLPGTYDIWVGSHRVNRYYPYVIEISETNPFPNRVLPAPGSTVTPNPGPASAPGQSSDPTPANEPSDSPTDGADTPPESTPTFDLSPDFDLSPESDLSPNFDLSPDREDVDPNLEADPTDADQGSPAETSEDADTPAAADETFDLSPDPVDSGDF